MSKAAAGGGRSTSLPDIVGDAEGSTQWVRYPRLICIARGRSIHWAMQLAEGGPVSAGTPLWGAPRATHRWTCNQQEGCALAWLGGALDECETWLGKSVKGGVTGSRGVPRDVLIANALYELQLQMELVHEMPYAWRKYAWRHLRWEMTQDRVTMHEPALGVEGEGALEGGARWRHAVEVVLLAAVAHRGARAFGEIGKGQRVALREMRKEMTSARRLREAQERAGHPLA